MNCKRPLIIGITGQTGSGKSTLCLYLKEKGYEVIDADISAREVVEKGSECLNRLVAEFGDLILLPDKSLNRRILGKIVFSDSNKLEKLNSIIYPYIIDNIKMKIRAAKKDLPFVFLDAPTLFESGADSLCDFVICVTADKESRLKRIIKRDELDYQSAFDRINAQHEDEFYKTRSDFCIENNGSTEDMIKNANEIFSIILKNNKDL